MSNDLDNGQAESNEWSAEQVRQQAGRIASADQARMYATFYRTLIENGVKPNHAAQMTCTYMRVLNRYSMGSK